MRFPRPSHWLAVGLVLAAATTRAQEGGAPTEIRVQQLETRIEEQQKLIQQLLDEVRALKKEHTAAESPLRPGDDPETAKLRRLAAEEKKAAFDALPDRVSKLEKDSAKTSGMIGKLGDGLKFSSGDGNFEGYVGGRVRMHMRNFFDRPDAARTSPDSFFLREIRFETGGTFFQDYEFKVQVDFPTGAAAVNGSLQDGYLGWKHFPEASLRIGQFKEPVSQEETTSGRFIDFNERSVASRLVPGRDLGFMIHGVGWDRFLEYEVGVFNGQGRAVVDTNDEKEVAARLRFNPLLNTDVDLFKGLRVGACGTAANVDNQSASSGSPQGLDFTTTELGILFLDSAAGSIDGMRYRYGVEFSWLYQGLGLRAEYIHKDDIVTLGAGNADFHIDQDAWYLAATWLLTGEKKSLENRIVPLEPFSISEGTWGAFELAFRVANLRIDDEIFEAGIAPEVGNSNEVTTYTLGFNWWPTRNFRISPNIIVEDFEDDVHFGAQPMGKAEDTAFGMLTRFQIDF